MHCCEPHRCGKKGGCGKSHTELRKILPKLNYVRKPDAPYDLAERMLPKDLLEGLTIQRTESVDVLMGPSILSELGLS